MYVKITDDEESQPIEIETEDDGTLTIENVTTIFPNTTTLKYRLDEHTWRAVKIANGRLLPPEGGWSNSRTYSCVFPRGISKTSTRKTDDVNLAAEVCELKKKVEQYEDRVMELQLQLGLLNVGEGAADMLITREKPKSARGSIKSKSKTNTPESPLSEDSTTSVSNPPENIASTSRAAAKTLKPLPPISENDLQYYEILRDGRDDLVHSARDHRDAPDGPSFMEKQVNAVLESEAHLKKRRKLDAVYENQLSALHKIKGNF